MQDASRRAGRIPAGLIVALVALFVALGGTAYAVAKISGKSIAARSIPGNRLAKKAVTKAEINFKRLGKVPSAVVADRTQSIVNQSLVRLSNGGNHVINKGPFRIIAGCAVGGGKRAVSVNVQTTGAAAAVDISNGRISKVFPRGATQQIFKLESNAASFRSFNFSLAANEGSASLDGVLSVGVGVLGADCTFGGFGIASGG